MDITIAPEIPCVELPKLGELPKIPLLGGAELNAFIDVAGGAPTDCKLTFNLLVQLGPLFASLACLFKILDVIGKISDFATAVPDPVKLGKAVPALVGAIADLQSCIPPLQIPNLLRMLKAILMLILNFLACVLEQIDSVLKFRATIDLDGAADNPALLKTLTCAQNTADAAMGNVMASLKPIAPLMNVVKLIAGIAMPGLALPDLASLSAEGSDVERTVASLESTVKSLRDVVASIPG